MDTDDDQPSGKRKNSELKMITDKNVQLHKKNKKDEPNIRNMHNIIFDINTEKEKEAAIKLLLME